MSIEDDPVLSEAGRLPEMGGPPVEVEAKPSTFRNVVEWAVIAGGALLVAFVIKTFLLQAFYIPSLSMAPTLQQGQRVLVDRFSHRIGGDPKLGDITVFMPPR